MKDTLQIFELDLKKKYVISIPDIDEDKIKLAMDIFNRCLRKKRMPIIFVNRKIEIMEIKKDG